MMIKRSLAKNDTSAFPQLPRAVIGDMYLHIHIPLRNNKIYFLLALVHQNPKVAGLSKCPLSLLHFTSRYRHGFFSVNSTLIVSFIFHAYGVENTQFLLSLFLSAFPFCYDFSFVHPISVSYVTLFFFASLFLLRIHKHPDRAILMH